MPHLHPKPVTPTSATPVGDPFISLAQIEATIQRLRRRPANASGMDALFDPYERPRTQLMTLYRDLLGKRLGGMTLSTIPIEARGVLQPGRSAGDAVS